MKKTILALAAAGLSPLLAAAAPPEPGSSAQPSAAPPPVAASPAPGRFEPRTMFGDVARVLSSRAVYEKAPASPRECRMDGTGYSSAASELPPCDEAGGARERIVAYDVTYQYMGREFMVRMPYDPGEQMAVNVIVAPPGPDHRSGYRIPHTRGPY
jgi:hypothetical protein